MALTTIPFSGIGSGGKIWCFCGEFDWERKTGEMENVTGGVPAEKVKENLCLGQWKIWLCVFGSWLLTVSMKVCWMLVCFYSSLQLWNDTNAPLRVCLGNLKHLKICYKLGRFGVIIYIVSFLLPIVHYDTCINSGLLKNKYYYIVSFKGRIVLC